MDAGVAGVEEQSTEEDTEGQREIPQGWCWAKLGAVAQINPSTRFDSLDEDSEIPFIPMSAVAEESGEISLSTVRPVREIAKGYVRFMDGDVIFAKITPCMENGKVAPVTGLPDKYAAGSTEFHVFRPVAVDQRYLWYWLVSRAFRSRAQRNMSGSAGQLRVPVDYIRDEVMPLAPLAEQRRIVARIDELFAQIAEGEAALEAARRGLDTFRRALLKAAVTGELTKDWRAANPISETGHDLLARIKAERAPKAAAKGRARRTTPAPPRDTSTLPQLPQRWAWATLRDLLARLTSGSRDWAEYYDKGNKVFIMAQNVRPGRYNHSYVKHVDPPEHLKDVERSRVQRDDLLVTIVGANTGDVCRIDFDVSDYFVCQSVALMRPIARELAPFLEMYLIAPDGGRKQIDKAIYGAGRPHLSFDQIEAFMIPIPPPAESAEILRRVSDALSGAADTVAMLNEEAADTVRLKQSVLKSAFEGRLVPQDPADEPASALLARLKASMGITAPRGRGKNRKSHA